MWEDEIVFPFDSGSLHLFKRVLVVGQVPNRVWTHGNPISVGMKLGV